MRDDNNFSLQNEIHKRKTQRLQQVSESKQLERAVDAPQKPEPAKQPDRVVSRETGKPAISVAKQTQQRLLQTLIEFWQLLSVARRQQLVVAVAALFILSIIGATILFTRPAPTPTMNQLAYPTPANATVQQVIDYLQKMDIQLTNISTIDRDSTWHADQQIAFDVIANNEPIPLILLSYPSVEERRLDFGTLVLDPKYEHMRFIESANILLLFPDSMDKSIQSALGSHLRSLLEAPYYSYLPTPTLRSVE
jgi:hypothetical protein